MKSIEITIRDESLKRLMTYCPKEVKCKIKENGEISYILYDNELEGNCRQVLNLKKCLQKEVVREVFNEFTDSIEPLGKQVKFPLDSYPQTIVLKNNNKKLISIEANGTEIEVKNFYKIIENLLKCKFKLLNIKFESLI